MLGALSADSMDTGCLAIPCLPTAVQLLHQAPRWKGETRRSASMDSWRSVSVILGSLSGVNVDIRASAPPPGGTLASRRCQRGDNQGGNCPKACCVGACRSQLRQGQWTLTSYWWFVSVMLGALSADSVDTGCLAIPIPVSANCCPITPVTTRHHGGKGSGETRRSANVDSWRSDLSA